MMDSVDTTLLTIVIPTYNRKDLLLKAVKSVTDQQVQSSIIHIYDNCSTDGTDKLIQELMCMHSNIRYTRRNSNLGSLANYSDAICSVKTPFLMSLADDDWLLTGGVQLLLDTIVSDESLGCVVSQTIHQNEDGVDLRVNPGNEWDFKRYSPEEFIPLWVRHGHFEWSSIIFRRKALDLAGVPDISTDLVWDVDLQLQVFFRYPVRLIEYKSAVFLLHPNQSFRQSSLSKFLGQLLMLEKSIDYARSNSPQFIRAMKNFSNLWFEKLAADTARNNNFFYFKETIEKMISRDFELTLIFKYVVYCFYFKLKGLKKKLFTFSSKPKRQFL